MVIFSNLVVFILLIVKRAQVQYRNYSLKAGFHSEYFPQGGTDRKVSFVLFVFYLIPS